MNNSSFVTPAGKFPIQFELNNDTLRGRIGGALQGQNFELKLRHDGMSGNLGKNEIELVIKEGELVGQIAGTPIHVRGVENISGRFGQTLLALSLNARQHGDVLIGTLGANHFELQLADTPAWLGAVVACMAQQSLNRT